MPKTTTGRFFAVLIGCTLGTAIGFYSLSDYQIIKKLPPPPIEFNEDGTPKGTPFKVTFRETTPLTLKPEVIEKRRLAEQKYLEEQRKLKAAEQSQPQPQPQQQNEQENAKQ